MLFFTFEEKCTSTFEIKVAAYERIYILVLRHIEWQQGWRKSCQQGILKI